MDREVAEHRRRQDLINKTVLLRHPKSRYLHRAFPMAVISSAFCDECGAGFCGIVTAVAQCGANLPGQPPRDDEERQWFHGGFDVVNLVDEPEPEGPRCKRCFSVR